MKSSKIHRDQIDLYGGSHGLSDRGVLESAAATPAATFDGEYLHSSIPDIAAAYSFHLCPGHAFIDGNKRVGIEAAIVFVGMNDWELTFEPGELTDLVLGVALLASSAKPSSRRFSRSAVGRSRQPTKADHRRASA